MFALLEANETEICCCYNIILMLHKMQNIYYIIINKNFTTLQYIQIE
jgi:hypothetical protein